MNPEDKARQIIDEHLQDAGWTVQDYREMNISAGPGVAIRKFPLLTGEADYLLYVDGQVAGVIEAKPVGHTLTGVEIQSAKYISGFPPELPHCHNPLPFAYESTGIVTQFTNTLDPDPRSRELFTFHRPEELRRLLNLEEQLRRASRRLPPLREENLWPVQVRAIRNLERSVSENRPRALIQMSTGSGKTFVAISAAYRLIKFANAKRILFLVDRANLGRQAYREFQQYVSPYTGLKFTDEYNVQHLRKNTIDPVSRACITTIQRLYSILKGDPEFDEANEESSFFEQTSLMREPVPVVYNPSVPIEHFDVIFVDECHRSIYNVWRQVLEYFDAFIVGLTATPSKQTIGFFSNNLVMDYGHSQAVADGVNVGYEIYRIRTKITEQGATLEAEPGRLIPHRDRRTRAVRLGEINDALPYEPRQLDRDVVNPSQIRLVIQTFRDRLFTDVFPGRTEVPKTLVFAKDDSHADDITRIMREEFGRGNDFCQKITYRTTGKKPEDVLAEFRNSYNPRISVTVDMIATGTDIKPLECLFFLRDVRSANYFEQMKGRGVRVIDPDTLQQVTPDAKSKTHFVIIDAVGVCESDKTESRPLDREPSIPLKKLLATVATGVIDPNLASTLAARLARLNQQIGVTERTKITDVASGHDLSNLTRTLLDALDTDQQEAHARRKFNLLAEEQLTPEQLDIAERDLLTQALKPFHNPKLREAILAAQTTMEQVIDEITQDELVGAGYDPKAIENAQALVQDFQQFIHDHKDELEALRVFYSRPYRACLRFKAIKELADALKAPPLASTPERIWYAYHATKPQAVRGRWGKLIDVIALVRHAIDPSTPIIPFRETVEERYTQWLAMQDKADVQFTPEQRQWLDAIKNHIANSVSVNQDDFEYAPFIQLGGLGKAYDLFGDRLHKILSDLNEKLAA